MNKKYFLDYALVAKNQIKRSQIIQKAYLNQKPSHRVNEFPISILILILIKFQLIRINQLSIYKGRSNEIIIKIGVNSQKKWKK